MSGCQQVAAFPGVPIARTHRSCRPTLALRRPCECPCERWLRVWLAEDRERSSLSRRPSACANGNGTDTAAAAATVAAVAAVAAAAAAGAAGAAAGPGGGNGLDLCSCRLLLRLPPLPAPSLTLMPPLLRLRLRGAWVIAYAAAMGDRKEVGVPGKA